MVTSLSPLRKQTLWGTSLSLPPPWAGAPPAALLRQLLLQTFRMPLVLSSPFYMAAALLPPVFKLSSSAFVSGGVIFLFDFGPVCEGRSLVTSLV